MAITTNDELFKGKSFSDLMGDIYSNQTSKKKQIDVLVNELRPYITSASEAALIVPLIKEYIEVGVKNDEQLVKLAAIYQKVMSSENRNELMVAAGMGGSSDGAHLSEEEKMELNQRAQEYSEIFKKKEIEKEKIFDLDDEIGKEVEEVKKKVEDIKKQDETDCSDKDGSEEMDTDE